MFSEDNSVVEVSIDLNMEVSNSSNSSVSVSDTAGRFKRMFDEKLIEYDEKHLGSQRKPWTQERIDEVINEIKNARVTMNSGRKRTSMEYYWMGKYDIVTIEKEDHLIFKKSKPTEPNVRIIPREQYYDVLSEIHRSCGHGGRDKMLFDIKNRYLYIPKKAVELLVSFCPTCETKRSVPKRAVVTRPVSSPNFNTTGHVDLIDFQSCPDGEYKWLLNYQDDATKFSSLRPLKTKMSSEVALELMKIFLSFGAPDILQSENEREFMPKVIEELVAILPDCKIVCGIPRRNTQGGVVSGNQDTENMLRTWMTDNNSTKWSIGCYFVQYNKNASFHRLIGKSPYRALFGCEPKIGLTSHPSKVPESLLMTIKTEKQETLVEEQPSNVLGHDNVHLKTENNLAAVDTGQGEGYQQHFTCPVCQKETTGARNCSSCACDNVVHAVCGFSEGGEGYGYRVSCFIKSEPDVQTEGEGPDKGLKRTADDTTDDTAKKPNLDIGDTALGIPKVECESLDPPNVKDEHSMTNYSEQMSSTPISVSNKPTSLGYGFVNLSHKCTCKPAAKQCQNNRCICFKNSVRCGPKCHSSLACINKIE